MKFDCNCDAIFKFSILQTLSIYRTDVYNVLSMTTEKKTGNNDFPNQIDDYAKDGGPVEV